MGVQCSRQLGGCLPYDSRTGKCIVDDTREVVFLTESCHSRKIWYLQQRVADSFNVKHLSNTI